MGGQHLGWNVVGHARGGVAVTHALTVDPSYPAGAIPTTDIMVPDSGDAQTAASVNDPMGAIVNIAALGAHAAFGPLIPAGATVEPGGSASVFTINVDAGLTFCAVDPDGVWRIAGTGAVTTAHAADIEGAPGSLSPDTWYSVFAYQGAAGVVHLEVSTTAPDAARQFKTGSLSRVYVTRFRTDGAGAPLAQRSNGRGVVRYLKRSGPRYDGTGPTTGYAALSLATAIPPGARFGLLRVTLTGDATWRAIGATPEGDGTPDSGETDVVLPASGRNIEWSSALSGSVSAIVRGYTE